MTEQIAPRVFELDSSIRYVAVNRNGVITEMTQNPKLSSHNPHPVAYSILICKLAG